MDGHVTVVVTAASSSSSQRRASSQIDIDIVDAVDRSASVPVSRERCSSVISLVASSASNSPASLKVFLSNSLSF